MKTKKFKGHEFTQLSSAKKKGVRKCSTHNSELIKFVCETCKPHALCCPICIIDNGHQEKAHKLSSVEKYVATKKAGMQVFCNESDMLLAAQKDIMRRVDGHIATHKENTDFYRACVASVRAKAIESLEQYTNAWLEDINKEGNNIQRILNADKKIVQFHISNGGFFIDTAEVLAQPLEIIHVNSLQKDLLDVNGNTSKNNVITKADQSKVQLISCLQSF